MKTHGVKYVLFVAFILSGFAGLMYESVWSHYLKLVLGHAAYAQTLVLMIFMGGLALGAWLVSKYTHRVKNPVMAYAIIELVIGLTALVFHSVFTTTQGWLYDYMLVLADSQITSTLMRWSWAAILITPQSILLGATFPLMSAGIIRLEPGRSGFTLSMLYFTNSLGAAVGVLFAGFYLIGQVGLPGTVLTAGLINVAVALLVWLATKTAPELGVGNQAVNQPGGAQLPSDQPTGETPSPGVPNEKVTTDSDRLQQYADLLVPAAFLTGLGSFMYEIGWIRMLSMVLGSSIQAFELMLSAFITGLAFGGFWIRKRIDHVKNVLCYAGVVQIFMSLTALATILLYNYTFDLMVFSMAAIQKSDPGYYLFNLISHLICFGIMLPSTFLAGMTLPLFTNAYIRAKKSENGIGRIYAFNTLGSITGIFIAVYIVMPTMGLKSVIGVGCLVDLALGLVLFYLGYDRKLPNLQKGFCAVAVCLFLMVTTFGQFNVLKMSSGAFRTGVISTSGDVVFHEDGRTASISVIQHMQDDVRHINIVTNGKPDASATFDDVKHTSDEVTMTLTAALPLAAHPAAKTAAVIGMGSGITSNVLLQADQIERVDTIEIEKKMVEGAKLFGKYSELVYSDPRSHVYIDDAKAFFSTQNKRYDLILSEPSNPWVAGVGNLFTKEFYKEIKKYLAKDALFVQWIQAYEIDVALIASIFKSLSKEFKYISVYRAHTTSSDFIMLASNDRKTNSLDPWIFDQATLAKSMARVGVIDINDLYASRLATEKTLVPLMNSYELPGNSDFFPVLTRQAPRSRFLGHNAIELVAKDYLYLNTKNLLNEWPTRTDYGLVKENYLEAKREHAVTQDILQHLVDGEDLDNKKVAARVLVEVFELRDFFDVCAKPDDIQFSSSIISHMFNLYLLGEQRAVFWQKVLQSPCFEKIAKPEQFWARLYYQLAVLNFAELANSAEAILLASQDELAKNSGLSDHLLTLGLIGYLNTEQYAAAKEYARKFHALSSPWDRLTLNTRMLVSMMEAHTKEP